MERSGSKPEVINEYVRESRYELINIDVLEENERLTVRDAINSYMKSKNKDFKAGHAHLLQTTHALDQTIILSVVKGTPSNRLWRNCMKKWHPLIEK